MTVIGKRVSRLPKNIWLLFLAQPLVGCAAPLVIFAGGILGARIAPSPDLATLPLTMMILGTAFGVIPASMLMNKVGRKRGTMIGFTIAIAGTLLATHAAMQSDFLLLVAGTLSIGFSLAFVAQLRFAALESLDDPILNPKAISLLMTSGLFAAILGPEVAVVASQWIDSPHGFAGSFLSLAVLFSIAILIISRLDSMAPAVHESHENA
ncbi:MAG: MFS transporter, partial [Gammaproteobacteria bacterium]